MLQASVKHLMKKVLKALLSTSTKVLAPSLAFTPQRVDNVDCTAPNMYCCAGVFHFWMGVDRSCLANLQDHTTFLDNLGSNKVTH